MAWPNIDESLREVTDELAALPRWRWLRRRRVLGDIRVLAAAQIVRDCRV